MLSYFWLGSHRQAQILHPKRRRHTMPRPQKPATYTTSFFAPPPRTPFDSIPTELLVAIMDLTCNWVHPHIHSKYGAPHNLFLVSKRWYQVALSSPRLWISIYMDISEWDINVQEYRARLRSIQKRTRLAANLPLNLYLYMTISRRYGSGEEGGGGEEEEDSDCDIEEDFLPTRKLIGAFLHKNNSKWRTMILEINDPTSAIQNFLPSSLPNLEVMSIHGLCEVHLEEPPDFPIGICLRGIRAPKLHTLHAANEISDIKWNTLGLPCLTKVTLSCHPDIISDSLLCLAVFKNLRSLTISQQTWHESWYWDKDRLSNTPSSSILLPSLEELEIKESNVEIIVDALRIFNLPMLVTLYVDTTRCPGGLNAPPLTLNYPSLRSFAFTDCCGSDVELVRAVLAGAANLTRLAIYLSSATSREASQVDTSELSWRRLLFVTHGDKSRPLCPRLRHLYTSTSKEEAEVISLLLPGLVISQGFGYNDNPIREIFEGEGQLVEEE